MRFPFSYFVARRYLLSKKSKNLINIISAVSTGGIIVGTAALIVVLSVFNGFEVLVMDLFNSFNPDIKVKPAQGKSFVVDTVPLDKISEIEGVKVWTETVEETVLFRYGEKQHIGRIKGYSESFNSWNSINKSMYDGDFNMGAGDNSYANVGLGVAYYLGLNIQDFSKKLQVYVPKKGHSTMLENAFSYKSLPVSGVFTIQQEVDTKYVVTSIDFVKDLLRYENEVSAIEIMVEENAETKLVLEELSSLLGADFVVQDRYQQEEMLYKIMKSEKWIIFLILSFIILIASFNVIGSLTVLIIEKQKDISILKSVGASVKMIRKIFIIEGMLINVFGLIIGIIIGGGISFLQQELGIVKLNGGNSFIVEAYPVRVQLLDFVYSSLTVLSIGVVAVIVAVRRIDAKILN